MAKVRNSAQRTGTAGAERREFILKVAARLFAEKGYDSTTMRDVAVKSGILAGSIYYHFASKEELYVEVVTEALDSLLAAVSASIGTESDPWRQFEIMAETHADVLLSSPEIARIFTPQYFHILGSKSRRKIVSRRNEYEALIASIVDRLDLPEGTDRTIFRLFFLGALNWATFWYRPSSDYTPRQLGRSLAAVMKPFKS